MRDESDESASAGRPFFGSLVASADAEPPKAAEATRAEMRRAAARTAVRNAERAAEDTGPVPVVTVEPEPTMSTATPAGARRIADLTSQIDFLNNEVARYRELLETERIRHATELANQQLATDGKVDAIRRDTRLELQAVHASYRNLMTEQQLEYEEALSAAAAESASALQEEQDRHQELLSSEVDRRKSQVESARLQVVEEMMDSHETTRHGLLNELSQAADTIERLRGDLDNFVERAQQAELRAHEHEVETVALRQKLKGLEDRHVAKLADLRAQLERASQRVESERQRSAATLTEVLERSAAEAAASDRAKTEHAEALARAEHKALEAYREAKEENDELRRTMDDRGQVALEREIELESVIAELRMRLGDQ